MSHTFPDTWAKLNVVLAHDWLTGMRGGERCLEILCEGFPHAPIFTLIHNRAAISETINRHSIRPSGLQSIPTIFRNYRYFLPTFPAAIASLHPPAADLLISTSHCAAKALTRPAGAKHLCYCFTPMRYAWTFHDEYLGTSWKRAAAAPVLRWLRGWDKKTAANVDRFVAISEHVRQRIIKFYEREADVVFPPVNTDFYTPLSSLSDGGRHSVAAAQGTDGYDLVVSALVPYKRVDLAVQAYSRLGFPLKVVGTGTEFETLKVLAGENVEFLGWKSDADVRDLYRGCRFLIFPGEEDFGIVPLEAQACGKPVIAFARGGALETLADGSTAVFFKDQTDAAILAAVETAAATRWDTAAIRRNAERFSPDHFIQSLDRSIQTCLRGC